MLSGVHDAVCALRNEYYFEIRVSLNKITPCTTIIKARKSLNVLQLCRLYFKPFVIPAHCVYSAHTVNCICICYYML